jgi:RHS repeat-associated protein
VGAGLAVAAFALTGKVLATDPDGGTTPSFSGALGGTPHAWAGSLGQRCCQPSEPLDGIAAVADADVAVAVNSGELVFRLDLARTGGVMSPFVFGLSYDSQSLWDGYVGVGMTSMLDQRVTVMPNGDVMMLMEDGVSRLWPSVGGGNFTAPGGVLDTLVLSAGSYVRTRPDGFTYTYGLKLNSLQDRFGNTTTIAHNVNGDPTSITDTRGVSHTVVLWPGTGRLKQLQMDDGRTWTFKYDGDANLVEIDGPTTTSFSSGITLHFGYSSGSGTPALNHNMISAIDGRGDAWLGVSYDGSDRVSSETVGGNSYSYSYGSPSTYKTTVTDRAGNERVWEWDSTTLARKSLVEETNRNVRAGEGDYTTSWTSDAAGYVTSATFPRGNGIKWTLNVAKLPTEQRRKADMSVADDNTNDLVEDWGYDPSKYFGTTSYTDARGNVTSYTLNAKGQPTTTTFPTVTNVTPNVTVTNGRTFNSDGTLDSFTDGDGKVTKYVYYASPTSKKGRLSSVTKDSGGLNLETDFDYDAAGHMTSTTDPRGYTTSYTVEAYGNVTEIDAPSALGYVTKLSYDGNLNVTQRQVKNIDYDGTWLSSPQWWTTAWQYTTMNKVSRATEDVTASATRVTYLSYDANDNLSSVTRGSEDTDLVYDERDLLYQRTRDPSGIDAVETFDYDGNRNATTYVNARGKTTTTDFDLFDRRDRVTNALAHYRTTSYDKDGHAIEVASYSSTAALLADHKQHYDEMGRFWKEEDLLAGSPDVWYARTATLNGRGFVTKLDDRRGYDTTFTYDGAGRRSTRTDAVGNVETWTHDANGNVTELQEAEVVPGGGTETYETDFAYDALNRMSSRTVVDRTNSSNTKVTQWQRDALNFVRRMTDPLSHVTVFTRDGLARTLTRQDPVSTTSFAYDQFDNETSLTDDNGKTTGYSYDLLNRLTQKTYHDSTTVAYVLDANGNPTSITDQNGTVTAQTFDDLDRLTARSLTLATGVGGPTAESFGYDGLDRLTQATNDDSIVNFAYDTLSRVLTEQQGQNPLGTTGKTVSYTYDAESQRTQVSYPSSFAANESRDAIGCLMGVTDGSSATIASFDMYGAMMRTKKTTFGNGASANYTYDGFRRTTDISHQDSGHTEFAGFTYGWDKADNPLYEARSHQSGHGDVYSYDAANRLTRTLTDVADPAAEVATPGSQTYANRLDYNMDGVFNLTSYVTTPYGGSATTTSYTTNSMNEYTAVGSTSPTYDSNGNLKTDGTYTYKYDGHNRLIEVKQGSTTVATYKHDAYGLGRRISKTVGSATTRFVYADEQSIEEYDGWSSGASLLRLFVFGEKIDQVLMMEAPDVADVDGDSNTTELMRFYYHTQLVGSVMHVTDPSQNVVESYTYDPYGKPSMTDKNGSAITSSAIGNPYLFTGRQLDEETGLYYYRAREYSPTLRRFIQRDPFEYVDGPNAYSYARSMPTATVDPTGLTVYVYSDDADTLYKLSSLGGLGYTLGPADKDGKQKVTFTRDDNLCCWSATFRKILEDAAASSTSITINFPPKVSNAGDPTDVGGTTNDDGEGGYLVSISQARLKDACCVDGGAQVAAYELYKVTSGQSGQAGKGTDTSDPTNSPPFKKGEQVQKELDDAKKKEAERAKKEMERQKKKEDERHGH